MTSIHIQNAWKMFCPGDLVFVAENEAETAGKLRRWGKEWDPKGLRMNNVKTKVMPMQAGDGTVTPVSVWLCAAC